MHSHYNMLARTIALAGIQFAWTVELAAGTPHLISLGLSNSFTAAVWIAGPLAGLIVQPIVGELSDNCRSIHGRRRPFIVLGTILVIGSIFLVAFARPIAIACVSSSWVKFTQISFAVIGFFLLDFGINIAQAAARILLVDTVSPEYQHVVNAWAACMVGAGNIVGYFVGYLDLVAILPFLNLEHFQLLCLLASFCLAATVFFTCSTVHEKVYTNAAHQRPWYETMTNIIHNCNNVPSDIQNILNIQFLAWLAWFPFLFYSSSWIADTVQLTPTQPDTIKTQMGSFGLLLFAIISFIFGIIIPRIQTQLQMALKHVWCAGLLFSAFLLMCTLFVGGTGVVVSVVGLMGISWAIALWVPFTLIGKQLSTPQEYTTIEDPNAHHATLNSGIILGIHNMYICLPQFISTLINMVIFSIVSVDAFGWVIRISGISSILAALYIVKTFKSHDCKFD
ncbi:major facilitator superfamily domain-containing protein [Globomyces pollinis-pini]|nr:major facilitator superfamily domain-containing protein [Globomyces pollinis-pini]